MVGEVLGREVAMTKPGENKIRINPEPDEVDGLREWIEVREFDTTSYTITSYYREPTGRVMGQSLLLSTRDVCTLAEWLTIEIWTDEEKEKRARAEANEKQEQLPL